MCLIKHPLDRTLRRFDEEQYDRLTREGVLPLDVITIDAENQDDHNSESSSRSVEPDN